MLVVSAFQNAWWPKLMVKRVTSILQFPATGTRPQTIAWLHLPSVRHPHQVCIQPVRQPIYTALKIPLKQETTHFPLYFCNALNIILVKIFLIIYGNINRNDQNVLKNSELKEKITKNRKIIRYIINLNETLKVINFINWFENFRGIQNSNIK